MNAIFELWNDNLEDVGEHGEPHRYSNLAAGFTVNFIVGFTKAELQISFFNNKKAETRIGRCEVRYSSPGERYEMVTTHRPKSQLG